MFSCSSAVGYSAVRKHSLNISESLNSILVTYTCACARTLTHAEKGGVEKQSSKVLSTPHFLEKCKLSYGL